MSSLAPSIPRPPFHVFHDFLEARQHAALLAWALDNQSRFAPAKLKDGTVDPEIRSALCLRDLGPSKAVLEQRVTCLVPELIRTLPLSPFDVTGIELELAAYNDGAHFSRHADTYTGERGQRGDRVLSGAYYFHRAPQAFSGGALRFHKLGISRDNEPLADLAPEQNSFVAFHAWWPHEVLTVHCPSRAFEDSRFAVNCWVYRAVSK